MRQAFSKGRTIHDLNSSAVGWFQKCCAPDMLRKSLVGGDEQALRRTWRRRPELLLDARLSEEDKLFLATLAVEDVMKKEG